MGSVIIVDNGKYSDWLDILKFPLIPLRINFSNPTIDFISFVFRNTHHSFGLIYQWIRWISSVAIGSRLLVTKARWSKHINLCSLLGYYIKENIGISPLILQNVEQYISQLFKFFTGRKIGNQDGFFGITDECIFSKRDNLKALGMNIFYV